MSNSSEIGFIIQICSFERFFFLIKDFVFPNASVYTSVSQLSIKRHFLRRRSNSLDEVIKFHSLSQKILIRSSILILGLEYVYEIPPCPCSVSIFHLKGAADMCTLPMLMVIPKLSSLSVLTSIMILVLLLFQLKLIMIEDWYFVRKY